MSHQTYWTVKDEDTGESVCFMICSNDMSTETLFEALSMLLLTKGIHVAAEKLWFHTKLNKAMADEIHAFELMPFFDLTHEAMLTHRCQRPYT